MALCSVRIGLPALIAAGLVAACGAERAPASAAGTTGGAGAPPAHAVPPEPGPGSLPDGTGTVTFAIRKVYWGDTDRDGTPDLVAGWRRYGFDLDGLISTETSTDLCTPILGASPKDVYPDGDDGIDNAFGHAILPILLGIDSALSTDVNASIAKGTFTSLFTLDQLGAAPDEAPISGRFYLGAPLGHPAAFDGSDVWPVRAASLSNPASLASAKVRFLDSYLVGDVWVGHASRELPFAFMIEPGFVLELPISSAVIAMTLSPDHRSATHGTIAGILQPEALIAALTRAAASFDPSLCVEPPIDSIFTQIRRACDIVADGTQDPSDDCSGITIGLGFDAAVVELGAILPEVVPPMPCSGE